MLILKASPKAFIHKCVWKWTFLSLQNESQVQARWSAPLLLFRL